MSGNPISEALRRFDASQGPRKLGPDEGGYVDLPGVGVRFMIWTEESGGGFSLVEHPIRPRYLCAPGGLQPLLALMDIAALSSGGLRGVIAK